MLTAGAPLRLLDVRTPAEYAAVHLPQSLLKPLEAFEALTFAREWKEKPGKVYVLCQSGTRAKNAIRKLEEAGVSDCVLVEGGIAACVAAGLSVERQATRTISLERQVRIAAGTLVLGGTLPGLLVHPAFLALPMFVGAGLVFAGVTDICGMGMLLARMPWNQSARNHDANCAGETGGPS
jgi:rhodanese-related sulfurtransferase